MRKLLKRFWPLSYLELVLTIFLILLSLHEFLDYRTFFGLRAVVIDSTLGSKYSLKQVDGQSPERITHGFFVTVVPLPLVKGGTRIFTLVRNDFPYKSEIQTEIEVKVENGKTYYIDDLKGEPIIRIKE